MVLNIKYHNESPKQFQNVKRYTLYTQPNPDGGIGPEIAIYFQDGSFKCIGLEDIVEVDTYND